MIMRLSFIDYTDEIIENLTQYILDRGYVLMVEDNQNDSIVENKIFYTNGIDTISFEWIDSCLSTKGFTAWKAERDCEFWDGFFKDGCPKCGAKKLTPSCLMFFKDAPGVKNIYENVELSFGPAAFDMLGVVRPNWICKNCGLRWGNEDELFKWSHRCKEGKELFDYDIVDWENKKIRFLPKKRVDREEKSDKSEFG